MNLRYTLLTSFALFSLLAKSQCLTPNSTTDITEYSDAMNCGVQVSYPTPTFNYTCGSGIISDTFYFTGALQTLTLPNGVTDVTIEVFGAQGGANWVSNTNFGGYNKADFTLSGGTVLNIFVGEQPSTGVVGGYNGGGSGDGAGKGGGGASDVRVGGTSLNDRIIVAGGGGGAGYWSNLHVVGGVGGGVNGGDGYRNSPADAGGLGATPSGPGASGTCINFNVPAMAGSFGNGGTPLGSNCGCEGYGGGGGYYGGAGSGNCRGGGGGSGYIAPTGSNTMTADGTRAGNGMVVITYGGTPAINVVQIAGLASGSTFPIGMTTNTFQATTATGDTAEISFTVTIEDTVSPVIPTLQDVTFYAEPGVCYATDTLSNPVATDNCGITLIASDAPSQYPIGNTVVTWMVEDASGNMAMASQNVQVLDTLDPEFTSITIDILACDGDVVQFGPPTATDNCSVTVNQISGPTSGSTLSTGFYNVEFEAVDPSGNSVTTFITIQVTDNPVVSVDIITPSSVVCVNDGAFTLAGEDPVGGIWSGTGVSGDQFDPSTAGVGTFQLTYVYTNFQGCVGSATDNIVVESCLGINENELTVIELFPNPSSGEVVLKTEGAGMATIYDAQGKLVNSYEIDNSETKIDLSFVSNGVYSVKFTSSKGLITTSKLIIQH